MSKSKIKPYLYLIPGLLLLGVFVYYPICRNIGYSFLKWDLFSGKKVFIGLKNYSVLFKSKEFPIALMINITGGLLVFNEVYIMTNGGPYGTTEVLSTIMYKNAFVHGKVGYAAAIANVILVLSALFSSLQFVGGESEKPKRIKRKGVETHV